MATKWYWHIHHDVLCEPASEPIAKRIGYIKYFKPQCEIETRLRLLKPVKGKIPVLARNVAELGVCYFRERSLSSWRNRVSYQRALKAFRKAYKKALPSLEELHAKECKNCPWNGQTIFPIKYPTDCA